MDAAGAVLGVLQATGVDTSAPVALAGPYARPVPFEVAVSGLQPSAETVSLEAWYALDHTVIPSGIGMTGAPSAGRFQVTGQFANLPDANCSVRSVQSRTGALDIETFVRRPYVADLLVDESPLALPFISAAAYDVAEHQIAWTEEGEGQVDAMSVYLSFRRGGVVFSWAVATAPDGTVLELPTLPAPWSDYNPRPTDETGSEYFFVRSPGSADLVEADFAAWSASLLFGVEGDKSLAFQRTSLP